MKIELSLLPEEYNLVHKGLSKLSIEEALPTLQNITRQAQNQLTADKPVAKEITDASNKAV